MAGEGGRGDRAQNAYFGGSNYSLPPPPPSSSVSTRPHLLSSSSCGSLQYREWEGGGRGREREGYTRSWGQCQREIGEEEAVWEDERSRVGGERNKERGASSIVVGERRNPKGGEEEGKWGRERNP